MRMTYTPVDGDRQEFIFRPQEMFNVEAEAIEAVGGDSWQTWDEFGLMFTRRNRKAWRAALWIMLRRTDPRLKFHDVVYRIDELTVEYEDDEVNQIREMQAEAEAAGKDQPDDDATDSP